MILSDGDIKYAVANKRLIIEPFNEEQLQPSSYDVTLSGNYWIQSVPSLSKNGEEVIDLRNPPDMKYIGASISTPETVIRPGRFILASTKERFEIPNHLAARLEGKSSLGRLGLIVHATAGYIDPGFKGWLTLELSNIGHWPIVLRAGESIAQVTFLRMQSTPDKPYGHPDLCSRYQDQSSSPVPYRPSQRRISA